MVLIWEGRHLLKLMTELFLPRALKTLWVQIGYIPTWLHASYTFTRKFKYIDLNQTKLVEFVSSFQNSNIFASFWNICKYQALSFWIKQLSFSFNRGFGSQRSLSLVIFTISFTAAFDDAQKKEVAFIKTRCRWRQN